MYALAYDAVIVYCEAMTVLMQKKETITADKLVAEIRKVRNVTLVFEVRNGLDVSAEIHNLKLNMAFEFFLIMVCGKFCLGKYFDFKYPFF